MCHRLTRRGAAALLVGLAFALPAAAYDFSWSGPGGTVVYRYVPRTGTLHDLEAVVNGFGFLPSDMGGITAIVLGGRMVRPASSLPDTRILEESFAGGAAVVRFRWTANGQSYDFRVKVALEGKVLTVQYDSESGGTPLEFGLDRSERTPRPKVVDIPFGHNVLFTGGIFVSGLLDPGVSRATEMSPRRAYVSATSAAFGESAVYRARTDGRVSPLREKILIAASPDIADTFFRPGNPVSPHRERMSRQVVLDIWDGSFERTRNGIAALASLGLKDIFTVIHVWQRDGYDNAYPTTYPAGARYGGDSGMRGISRACAAAGFDLALHSNYVDFYPNSSEWNAADVARGADGQWFRAWFNPSTKIQSYLLKPSRSLDYARRIEPTIHSGYGTTASFLDVSSSAPPSSRVDYTAGSPGAATHAGTLSAWRDLTAGVREIHGGPVAGEGGGGSARLWAGWIDLTEGDPRSQADAGAGRDGDHVPPIVDYKLRILQPLQVISGAGYLERFYAGRPTRWFPTSDYEGYRAATFAFGDCGFLGDPFNRGESTVDILRDYCLAKAVQAHTLRSTATSILYNVRGTMMPLSDALREILPAASFDDVSPLLAEELGQVRTSFADGFVLSVNRSKGRTWSIDAGGRTYTLPPASGFLGTVDGLPIVGTADVDGALAHFVDPAVAEGPCAGRIDDVIEAPVSLAGRRVSQRSLFLREDIDVLTWQPNPAARDVAGYRIYSVEGTARTLLGQAPGGQLAPTFLRRKAPSGVAATYAIVAVNGQGREGKLAFVTVTPAGAGLALVR